MNFRIFTFLGGLLSVLGCITPDTKTSRGVNSPMMNAYHAAVPQKQPSLWDIPLDPQAQMYALTGGILILMVIVILRSSQFKEK
jgi:hypothetical protein